LGGLGLLIGILLQLAQGNSPRTLSIPHNIQLVHTILAGVSKVALAFLGICLLGRRRSSNIVALACLTLSLTDSAYYQIKVVPWMQSGLHPHLATAISIGGWISMMVSAGLYWSICFYLDRPASRKEFRRTTV